jgi:hypothetical protein
VVCKCWFGRCEFLKRLSSWVFRLFRRRSSPAAKEAAAEEEEHRETRDHGVGAPGGGGIIGTAGLAAGEGAGAADDDLESFEPPSNPAS